MPFGGFRVKEEEPKRSPIYVGGTTATMFAQHGWDVVVFGSAPNPHSEATWSYERGSAARLARIFGRRMTWFNLFEREPETWSQEAAQRSAEEWCLTYARRLSRVPVIMLGTKVCNAFGVEDIEWLESYTSQLWNPMVAFPHPSGLNRWWNDPENEAKAWKVGHAIAQGRYFARTHSMTKEEID